MLNPQTNTVAVWNNVWAGETVTAQQILDVMLEQEADRSWQRYTKLVEEHLGGWARVRAIEVGGGASTHSLLAASKGAITRLSVIERPSSVESVYLYI